METGAGSQIALEAYTRSSPPFPAHQFFPGGGRTNSDNLNGARHTSYPTLLTADSSASPRGLDSLQHATYNNGRRMDWDMKSWDWDSVLFLAQPSAAAAAGLDDHRLKSSYQGAHNGHADQHRHPSISNGIDFGLDGGSSNPDLNACNDVDDSYHRGKYPMRSQEAENPSHSGKTQPFLRDGSSPEEDTESLSLKLGGHSYAYSEEGGIWSRDAKRYRSSSPGPQLPSCQVDDCKADLSHAKDYHRRHKVCEMHAKAVKALVSRLMQRFCQQCSRFHPLPEFDEGKRSCRRRLAGHNRRRRKNHPDTPPGRAYSGDENEAVGKAAGLVGILNLLSSLQALNSAGGLNGIGNERDAVLQYLKAMATAPANGLDGLTPAAVANLLHLGGVLPGNRASDSKLRSFAATSRGYQHPPANLDAELLSVLGSPQTREDTLALMLQQSSWRGQLTSALMKAAAGSSPLVQVGQSSGNCASSPPLAAANPGASRLTGDALAHANGGPVLSLSFPGAARPGAVPNITSSSRANGVHRQAIPENSVRQVQQFQAELLQSQAAPVVMAQKLFPLAQEAAGQGRNAALQVAVNVEDDGATGSTSDHDAPAATVMPSFADGQDVRILQDVSQQSRPSIDLQQPAFHYDTNESSPSGSDQSPSSSSADWQDRTGRISIKLFDRNPGELPHLLRSQILDWLAHRPLDMESYIRPGCIVLTVFLSMPFSAWSELERNLRASLQKLTQSDGEFWSSGRIHMQVDRRNAYVIDGRIHISKPLKALATPQLLSVRPCAVVAGQRTSIFLTGINLSQPETRVFVAYQGQYAAKEVLSANAPSPVGTGGWDEQSIIFDAGCPDVVGRAFIEVEKQLSGGNALPVIVADGPVCAELRTMEGAHIWNEREETADDRARRGDILHPVYAKDFLNELGWLFQKSQSYHRVVEGEGAGAPEVSPSRQKDLITFAVTQNWSAVVSKILDVVFGLMLTCPEKTTGGLSEIFGDEMSFLHLAVQKRCSRVVQLLLSYVPFPRIDSADRKVLLKDFCKHDSQNGHIFTPDMSGPDGLTPLHIAASIDGAEELIDALTSDPNQVGIGAWSTACNAEGDSPQVCALNKGNASYVEIVRRKIARRDNSVTITIPPNERVSIANDFIRAGGESSSHTAGSSAWTVKLSTWSDQDPAEKFSGGTKSVTVPRSCRHVPPILRGMRGGSVYRPFLLSMMTIAAVCVCACIIMRGSPDVNAKHSFSWASLAYGPQ